MSLPSLFLKETSEGDISLTKLPQDLDLWAETISTKVKELLPLSRGMVIKINFLNKNEELGTATGAITLHDQKLNRVAYIPLIVKNFSLYPLDILMAPKKDAEGGFEIMPLSMELFSEVMFNSDVFENLERPMDRIQQMYLNPQNLVVNPPFFRNVYASANSSLLDEISSTIPTTEKKAFIQNLKENQDCLVGYEKRSNVSILKKIAASKQELMKDTREETPNIILVKNKMGVGVNSISTSDKVFNPIIGGSSNTVLKKDIHDVPLNGEEVFTKDLVSAKNVMLGPNQSPKNYSGHKEAPIEIKSFGTYKVQDKNGVLHKGVVFPTIINFNMSKSSGSLFISPNKSSLQNKISGYPLSDVPDLENSSSIMEGTTISFCKNNDTLGIITTPVTVKSISYSYGDMDMIGITLLGKIVKIHKAEILSCSEDDSPCNLDGMTSKRIVKIKGVYKIPANYKVIVIKNFCDLVENPKEVLEKKASLNIGRNTIKIMGNGSNQYCLQGPDMAKMASMAKLDHLNLSKEEATFMLLAKQCPIEKCASALSKANSAERVSYIQNLPRTSYTREYSDFEVKVAHAAMEQINSLKCDLTKEASHLDDAQVVDTALSLNFINQDNVDKFISYIPLFEQCSKLLAQVLLASRLGIKELPESSTATTMNRMLDVIAGLKKLKTLGEKTAGVGSATESMVSKFKSTLQNIIKDKPLLSAGAIGGAGLYAGASVNGKRNYQKGYKDGAKAMDSYLKTRMGTKTASLYIGSFLKGLK